MGMVCDLNEYFMCIDEPVVFYIYIYIETNQDNLKQWPAKTRQFWFCQTTLPYSRFDEWLCENCTEYGRLSV